MFWLVFRAARRCIRLSQRRPNFQGVRQTTALIPSSKPTVVPKENGRIKRNKGLFLTIRLVEPGRVDGNTGGGFW
jgi:hypothetical protein